MSILNINYKKIDPEAKRDSNPTTTDGKIWSNMYDLKLDDVFPSNFMTCEQNYSILDGSMNEFPDEVYRYEWGWFSESISNEDGIFINPPTLDITFSSNHKSTGITLNFYPFTNDYAKEVRITWYDSSKINIIKSNIYELNSNIGIIRESVSEWRRIKIEMLSTNIQYRYIKLYSIEYGIDGRFTDDMIDTANILEEVDPLSDIISINTLRFRIKTHDPVFSPISGNIEDDMFMRKQMLSITSDNNSYGTFFLQSWKDVNNNGTTFDFTAQDAIGIMDNYRFMGDVYDGTHITAIIESLFYICFPTQSIHFEIDPALSDLMIYGWIPICSCREALQLICFSIGAIVDTSRRNVVLIKRRERLLVSDIQLNRIYTGGFIQPTEYFNGVDLWSFEYIRNGDLQEIHNGALPYGIQTIEFSEPFHGLSLSGDARLINSTANYITVEVFGSGSFILTGKRFTVNSFIFRAREEVAAGEAENICAFDKCTLITKSLAPELILDLFNYLKQRIQIENDIILDGIECGETVRMRTYARSIIGTVEKLDINLRGNTAKSMVVGSIEDILRTYVFSNEIECGEDDFV